MTSPLSPDTAKKPRAKKAKAELFAITADIIDFRQRRMSRTYADAVAEQERGGVREIPLYHMAKAMDDKPMLEALDAQARRAVIQSEKEAEALRKAGWKPTLLERLFDSDLAYGLALGYFAFILPVLAVIAGAWWLS